MNAIPLINNAPRPNINVGSIGSPAFNPVAAGAKLGGSIGGNVMRQNPASMPINNETQLRQEVNTSIVALKREAFSLENLIAQAAQTLQDINKRLYELEGKQGDYVKKADATVESVGGNGKYISAISETDGKISATATDLGNMVPVNSVTSGNMHSVTSGAVYSELFKLLIGENDDPDNFPIDAMRVYKVRNYNIGWGSNDGFIINLPWSDRFAKQIALDDQLNFMAVRAKNQGTWGNWENIVVAKTTVEDYTPKSYLDRVTFTNNRSKVYKVGNHVKLHIDVTVSQVNVTAGKFAFNIIDLAPTSYPLAIYYMSGVSGIGLTDASTISGFVWLKDYLGNELDCTALLNKRIFAEIDFFV